MLTKSSWARKLELARRKGPRAVAALKASVRASTRKWSQNNKEKERETRAKWLANNPDKAAIFDERSKKRKLIWQKEHPAECARKASKYRAKLRSATPSWADQNKINTFYVVAHLMTKRTGTKHEVDHIVPLQSKIVCGLHVPWNLHVVTKSENARKRNKLIDSLATLSIA